MRHAPSRSPALAAAGVLAGVLIAGPALAQIAPGQTATAASGEVSGLRYLSWPGKSVRTAPARIAAAAPSPRASAPAAAPSVETASTRADASSPRQGLTPASAFYTPGASLGGRFSSEPAPEPVSTPPASPEPEAQVAPEPRMRRVAPSPLETASTHAAPVPAPVPEPVAAPAPELAPPALEPSREPAPAPAADPMAPRRDAPIFRLQRQVAPQPGPAGAVADQNSAPHTAAVPSEPVASGARYYSVHRQHGQRPDAIAAPEPAWLDAMPVQLATAPAAATTDLAAPPAAPALRRDASGKLQPAAPLVNGDPS